MNTFIHRLITTGVITVLAAVNASVPAHSATFSSVDPSVNSLSLPQAAIASSQAIVAQQNGPYIDWGALGLHFNIYEPRVEKIQSRDPLGNINEFWAMTFVVEAKEYFTPYGYFAYFYDSSGIEVDVFSPVSFEPNYGSWQPGTRSRAHILLPSNMSRVALIRFDSL